MASESVSDAAWDGSPSRFTDEQYARSCVLDRGAEIESVKQRYSLPVREPDGTVNRNGVHAAAGGRGLSAVNAPAEAKKAAARKLVALYRGPLGEDPPEGLVAMAGKDAGSGMRRTVFPMSRIKLADPEPDGRRRIEGYAAVFANRDHHGDIIVKGAFDRTLREKPNIKVMWQHQRPIGVNELAYENDYGLVVRGVLSNTDFVKGEVMPLIEDGVVNGLSIGYGVREEEFTRDGNLLKDIDLDEWSPVTFAANDLAQVTHVKNLDSRDDIHADRVVYHAKGLRHELEGYFADSVRTEGLDLQPLVELEAMLRGKLAGSSAADAADAPGEDEAITIAYRAGVRDGMSLKELLPHARHRHRHARVRA